MSVLSGMGMMRAVGAGPFEVAIKHPFKQRHNPAAPCSKAISHPLEFKRQFLPILILCKGHLS